MTEQEQPSPTISTAGALSTHVPRPEELTDEHELVLCVSGGKDSSAMALWFRFESGLSNRLVLMFCDTGHEHPLTIAHVNNLADRLELPLNVIHPPLKFVELCQSKQRFPTPGARFCTEELKVQPSSEWLKEQYGRGLLDKPVLVQGIRWQESKARSEALAWEEYNRPGKRRVYDCPVWRPILHWTHEDVFAVHERHNFEPNPLYKMGAKRVGCFPCIYSGQADLRACFTMDPHLLPRLRDYEARVAKSTARGVASFFTSRKVPKRFHDCEAHTRDGRLYTYASIDAVYRWAMSNCREYDDMDVGAGCMSHYGLCE